MMKKYFKLQERFEIELGSDVIVFLSNDDMFEFYENKGSKKAKKIAKILNLEMIKTQDGVFACRFKKELLERFLRRILEEKQYTVVVVDGQKTDVFCLATDVELLDDEEHISSLVIACKDGVYECGYCAINFKTGKSFVSQKCGTKRDTNFALDEVSNLLDIYDGTKVIVRFMGDVDREYVFGYLELDEHYQCVEVDFDFDIKMKNELLQQAYDIHSLLPLLEHLDLQDSLKAADALCNLLYFVGKYNQNIVCKLTPPIVIDDKNFMYLGNNALEQLGIISRDKKQYSILNMFKNTLSLMGQREIKQRLLNPILDKDELLRRYDLVERVSSHAKAIEEIFVKIADIERLLRKLKLSQANELEIANIQSSLLHVKELLEYVKQHDIIDQEPFGCDEIDELLVDIKVGISMDILVEKRYSMLFDKIVSFVADIDVGVTSLRVARKYNHAKPNIVDVKDDENFLSLIKLRHPLVELQNNLYVPNDIVMGEREYLDLARPDTVMLDVSVHDGHNIDGVLLYGINSSGKSSLMKSIGIALLMAQSGFFVSASSMSFSVFDSIFTRIVSKDNLTKGLSTFAVEMVEMKNIFNRVTLKSLVLGDEISHGTETLSGVAIVASSIMKLSKMKCLFFFATHLHQLSKMPEITSLSNVANLHLSVRYDEKRDELIFDRVLKGGSGSSIYGLEFAKSLHLDEEFLLQANRIRKRLAKDFDEVELISKNKRADKEAFMASLAKEIQEEKTKVSKKENKILLDDW